MHAIGPIASSLALLGAPNDRLLKAGPGQPAVSKDR